MDTFQSIINKNMAAFDFPSSPSNGQTYSANGIDWIYNGSVWKKEATSGVKGQKGEVGQKGQKGEVGEKGTKGDKGDKGQKGEIGATGGTGGTGQKGQKGQDGNDATGTKGQKGEKGEIGPQGGSGGTGQKGEPGSGGSDGSDGDKGQKGDTGATTFAVPSGGIILWSGSVANIPSGWYLCNGSNGTPDLRNRFVIGAHSDSANSNWPNFQPGHTGGSNVSSLPSHTHSFSSTHSHTFSSSTSSDTHNHGITDPGHSHTMSANWHNSVNSGGALSFKDVANSNQIQSSTTGISINSDSHAHSFSGTTAGGTASGTTGSTGSAGDKSNLPPYYALCYIIKL